MRENVEEAKLLNFCADLQLDAAVDWRGGGHLYLDQVHEPELFAPNEEEVRNGRAELTVKNGRVCCRFDGFDIAAPDLVKICKLFLAARQKQLEEFYLIYAPNVADGKYDEMTPG